MAANRILATVASTAEMTDSTIDPWGKEARSIQTASGWGDLGMVGGFIKSRTGQVVVEPSTKLDDPSINLTARQRSRQA